MYRRTVTEFSDVYFFFVTLTFVYYYAREKLIKIGQRHEL